MMLELNSDHLWYLCLRLTMAHSTHSTHSMRNRAGGAERGVGYFIWTRQPILNNPIAFTCPGLAAAVLLIPPRLFHVLTRFVRDEDLC